MRIGCYSFLLCVLAFTMLLVVLLDFVTRSLFEVADDPADFKVSDLCMS